MTINYLDSKRIQGLSTDTKPTSTTVQTDSIFTETDTGKRSWSSNGWATFSDDFSTNKFTYSGTRFSYNSASARMDFNITANSGTDRAYIAIPAFGSTSWYLDYTITQTSSGGSGNTVGIGVYCASTNNASANYYGTEQARDTSIYTYTGSNAEFLDASYSWTTTTYYFRMTVNASTKTTVHKAYSSSANRTSNTSALFTATKTPATNATNLAFLVINSVRPTNGYTIIGYVKDISLYEGVP